MNAMERRLQKLEQDAPTGISRPPGLAGEAFAAHVIDQICGRKDLSPRQAAAHQNAWLDLLTHEEAKLLESMIRASMAEMIAADPSLATGRRGA